MLTLLLQAILLTIFSVYLFLKVVLPDIRDTARRVAARRNP